MIWYILFSVLIAFIITVILEITYEYGGYSFFCGVIAGSIFIILFTAQYGIRW